MPDETLRVAVEADLGPLDRALTDLRASAEGFGAAFATAMRGAATGGRTLEGVLRQLGQRLTGLALDAALKPVGTALAGALGQVAAGLGAGTAGAGAPPVRVTPFAKGGVVAAPTFFPAGGRLGLMGESGAEAVLPLRRGPDGTLGLAAPGGAGAATIVFNVQTPDAASFQRAEAQIQTLLARAALRGQRGL